MGLTTAPLLLTQGVDRHGKAPFPSVFPVLFTPKGAEGEIMASARFRPPGEAKAPSPACNAVALRAGRFATTSPCVASSGFAASTLHRAGGSGAGPAHSKSRACGALESDFLSINSNSEVLTARRSS